MAITGIDTIDGKQIIAAGAVSAKSAEMAYNDENGNPITGYQPAGDYYSASNPSGFITGLPEEEEVEFEEIDLTDYQPVSAMTAYQNAGDYYSASNPSGFITEVPAGTMNESAFGYDSDNKISSYNGSAIGGSAPTYGYTDNRLISSIDTSGLYATSADSANKALWIPAGRRLAAAVEWNTIDQQGYGSQMVLNPLATPFSVKSGIYSPLTYATGAVITYGSSGNGSAQYFGGFLKGNEWYISNATAGQALRGETHASRGVHISGATTAGYGFNLGINVVSGVNSTGSWKYGHAEDAALRVVSSCDMHESAFEYDSNDKISGYNGSAFAGGSDVPEGVMVESGLEYNAVNEISGYNGSAIAQYGAEKQWLVHDDTLVHASNSAQYALGVNLSAVAQLLGVDETVLWSGSMNSVGQSATLAEAISSFKNIEITTKDQNGYSIIQKFETGASGYNTFMLTQYPGRTNTFIQRLAFLTVPDQNHLRYTSGCRAVISAGTNSFEMAGPTVTKVIGIGRKEV